jgi:hypothetical protein
MAGGGQTHSYHGGPKIDPESRILSCSGTYGIRASPHSPHVIDIPTEKIEKGLCTEMKEALEGDLKADKREWEKEAATAAGPTRT